MVCARCDANGVWPSGAVIEARCVRRVSVRTPSQLLEDRRETAQGTLRLTGSVRAFVALRADSHRDPVFGALIGRQARRSAPQAAERPAGRELLLNLCPDVREFVRFRHGAHATQRMSDRSRAATGSRRACPPVTRRQVRFFLRPWRKHLAEAYGKAEAEAIAQESPQRFEALLPDVPYTGSVDQGPA